MTEPASRPRTAEYGIQRSARGGNSAFGFHLTTNSSSTLFDNLVAGELPAKGVDLICVDDTSKKTMRRALWLYVFLLSAYFALLPALLYWPASPHQATSSVHRLYVLIWGINAAVLTGLVALAMRVVRRRMRMRIGTDGAGLLFDNGGGTVHRFAWNDVYTNTRSLLIGQDRVSLYMSRTRSSQTVFPAEPLRSTILARLPASSYIGEAHLAWIALNRSGLNTRLMYGSIVLIFAVGQYLKYHRDLTEPLWVGLRKWLTR